MERNALEALLFLLGRGRAAATFREATNFRFLRENAREGLNGVLTKGGRILLKKAARECAERRAATKGGKEEQREAFAAGKGSAGNCKRALLRKRGLGAAC